MKIPDISFRLFLSGGGRILGVAPLEGQPSTGFCINHLDGTIEVMVIAVITKPCTMLEWEEIIRLAGTFENAAEMAVNKFGGMPWIYMNSPKWVLPTDDPEMVLLPFMNGGEIAEA